MAKQRFESRDRDYLDSVELLYKIFDDLGKNADNWKDFLRDMLTSSELRMIKKRWQIARLLSSGRSVRQISESAKVGTDTVVRISKKLSEGSGGLRKALQRSETPMVKSTQKRAVEYLAKRGQKGQKWVFGVSEKP